MNQGFGGGQYAPMGYNAHTNMPLNMDSNANAWQGLKGILGDEAYAQDPNNGHAIPAAYGAPAAENFGNWKSFVHSWLVNGDPGPAQNEEVDYSGLSRATSVNSIAAPKFAELNVADVQKVPPRVSMMPSQTPEPQPQKSDLSAASVANTVDPAESMKQKPTTKYRVKVPSLDTDGFEHLVHAVVWKVGRSFGFQAFNLNPATSNKNQKDFTPATIFLAADHISHILCKNYYIRRDKDADTPQERFSKALLEFHGIIFHSYLDHWCPLMQLLPRPAMSQLIVDEHTYSDDKIVNGLLCELSLWFLIYTESCNCKHCPELLWFLFWVMNNSYAMVDCWRRGLPEKSESRDLRVKLRNKWQTIIAEITEYLGLFPTKIRPEDCGRFAVISARLKQTEIPVEDHDIVADYIALGDGVFFMDRIITPIFVLFSYEIDHLSNLGVDTCHRLGYDDFNESLCHRPTVMRALGEMRVSPEQIAVGSVVEAWESLTSLGYRNLKTETNSHTFIDVNFDFQAAAEWWRTRVFVKTYRERRSWLTVYRAFYRVYALHVILFHLMMVAAFVEFNAMYRYWLPFTSVIITHAFLSALERFANLWCNTETTEPLQTAISKVFKARRFLGVHLRRLEINSAAAQNLKSHVNPALQAISGNKMIDGSKAAAARGFEDPVTRTEIERMMTSRKKNRTIEMESDGILGLIYWTSMLIFTCVVFTLCYYEPVGVLGRLWLQFGWFWFSNLYVGWELFHFLITCRDGYVVSLSALLNLPEWVKASSVRPDPQYWIQGEMATKWKTFFANTAFWLTAFAMKIPFDYWIVVAPCKEPIELLLEFSIYRASGYCQVLPAYSRMWAPCLYTEWVFIVARVLPAMVVMIMDTSLFYQLALTIFGVLRGLFKLDLGVLTQWDEVVREFYRAPYRFWYNMMSVEGNENQMLLLKASFFERMKNSAGRETEVQVTDGLMFKKAIITPEMIHGKKHQYFRKKKIAPVEDEMQQDQEANDMSKNTALNKFLSSVSQAVEKARGEGGDDLLKPAGKGALLPSSTNALMAKKGVRVGGPTKPSVLKRGDGYKDKKQAGKKSDKDKDEKKDKDAAAEPAKTLPRRDPTKGLLAGLKKARMAAQEGSGPAPGPLVVGALPGAKGPNTGSAPEKGKRKGVQLRSVFEETDDDPLSKLKNLPAKSMATKRPALSRVDRNATMTKVRVPEKEVNIDPPSIRDLPSIKETITPIAEEDPASMAEDIDPRASPLRATRPPRPPSNPPQVSRPTSVEPPPGPPSLPGSVPPSAPGSRGSSHPSDLGLPPDIQRTSPLPGAAAAARLFMNQGGPIAEAVEEELDPSDFGPAPKLRRTSPGPCAAAAARLFDEGPVAEAVEESVQTFTYEDDEEDEEEKEDQGRKKERKSEAGNMEPELRQMSFYHPESEVDDVELPTPSRVPKSAYPQGGGISDDEDFIPIDMTPSAAATEGDPSVASTAKPKKERKARIKFAGSDGEDEAPKRPNRGHLAPLQSGAYDENNASRHARFGAGNEDDSVAQPRKYDPSKKGQSKLRKKGDENDNSEGEGVSPARNKRNMWQKAVSIIRRDKQDEEEDENEEREEVSSRVPSMASRASSNTVKLSANSFVRRGFAAGKMEGIMADPSLLGDDINDEVDLVHRQTVHWNSFAFAWDEIINDLREMDLISDKEKGILKFVRLELGNRSYGLRSILLPAFFYAGQIRKVVDTGLVSTAQIMVLNEFRILVVWLGCQVGLMSGKHAHVINSAAFYGPLMNVKHGMLRKKMMASGVKLIDLLESICTNKEIPFDLQDHVFHLREILHGLEAEMYAVHKAAQIGKMNMDDQTSANTLLEVIAGIRSVTEDPESLKMAFKEAMFYRQQQNGTAFDFKQVARVLQVMKKMLLMTQAEATPGSEEAQRVLAFFINSLGHPGLDQPVPLDKMWSWSILTPLYEEDVLYALEFKSLASHLQVPAKNSGFTDLLTESQDSVSLMGYLKAMFPEEWNNFKERMCKLVPEVAVEEISEYDFADDGVMYEFQFDLQLWASMRGQLLGRTVRGMMCAEKGLRVLMKLEHPCPSDMSQLEYNKWMDQLLVSKFEYVVSPQSYGKNAKSKELKHRWLAEAMNTLVTKFPTLKIAYMDSATTTYGLSNYSVLLRGNEPNDPFSPLRSGGVRETYRVRFPVNKYSSRGLVIGEGKPENQAHACIFAFGEALQAVDMNQDNYLCEAMKMRNLLSELDPSCKGKFVSFCEDDKIFTLDKTSTGGEFLDAINKRIKKSTPTAICGFREFIFSEKSGSLGKFAAATEYAFGTITQRTMAHPARVRLHYGHPDIFNKIHIMTRGGMSKATRLLHLTEDVFTGCNHTLRGARIRYKEYIECGKGRDMGFDSILGFHFKVSTGGGEWSCCREMFRMGTRMDMCRLLSLYHSGCGFYINSYFTVVAIYANAYTLLLFSLADVFELPSLTSGRAAAPNLLVYNVQQVLQLGTMYIIPYVGQLVLETGLLRGLTTVFQQIVTGSLAFYTFQQVTVASGFIGDMKYGTAKYVSTGRGFNLAPMDFVKIYSAYARSHLYLGFEMLHVLVVLYVVNACPDCSYGAITWSTWFLSFTLIVSPLWFNAFSFDLEKTKRNFAQWRRWMNGDVDIGTGASWYTWNAEKLEKLRNDAGNNTDNWSHVMYQCLLAFVYVLIAWATLTNITLKPEHPLATGVLANPFIAYAISMASLGVFSWITVKIHTYSIELARQRTWRLYTWAVTLIILVGFILFVILFTDFYSNANYYISGYFNNNALGVYARIMYADFMTLIAVWRLITVLLPQSNAARGLVDAGFRAIDTIIGILMFLLLSIFSYVGVFHVVQMKLLFSDAFADVVKHGKIGKALRDYKLVQLDRRIGIADKSGRTSVVSLMNTERYHETRYL